MAFYETAECSVDLVGAYRLVGGESDSFEFRAFHLDSFGRVHVYVMKLGLAREEGSHHAGGFERGECVVLQLNTLANILR